MGKPKVAGNAKGNQVVPKNKSQIGKGKKNNKNNKQATVSPVANIENVTKVSQKSNNKLKAKGKVASLQISTEKKQKVEKIIKHNAGGDGGADSSVVKPKAQEKKSANGNPTMSKSKKKRLKKSLKRLEQAKDDGKTDITKLKKEILQKLTEGRVVKPAKAGKKSPIAGKGPSAAKNSGKAGGAKKAKKNKSKK